MSGKSTAVYSVEIGSAVTEGGSPDANLIPNPTADSVSFTGMATATGSVSAFSGSEGIVDEEQGRRTPGANRPTAVGVVAGATTFGANAVEVSENPGLLLQHRYGCRVDIGRDHDGVTGAASQIRGKSGAGNAGKPLPNFDHTIEVVFETAEGTPSTRGVLRGLTHEIHNATCNVSITTENDEELQKIITRDELRTLILGFGPGGSGADNPYGGAFILKNASRADGDANIEAGDGNRIQQSTNLMAVSEFSKYDGTPAAGAETQLATAPFILVLPKVG